MAANKCNIIDYTKPHINALDWGSTQPIDDTPILDNYVQFLNCPTVKSLNCYVDSCNSQTTVFTCDLAVSDIQVTNNNNTLIFSIAAGSSQDVFNSQFSPIFD